MASEIEICNLALTRLGADSIRSFSESNKRARLSQITYQHVRDLYLEDYEWSFNTKYIQLGLLANVTHPKYTYVYQVPSDCLYARQILNELGVVDSRIMWELFNSYIATDIEDAWLRYSQIVTNSNTFPKYFVEAVASQVAAELAPSIVQDKKRYDELTARAEFRLSRAIEKDAALGIEYRFRDQDPEFDSFINV